MGWKAKKIDILRLKHRNLRLICMRLDCHSHGFAALRHCYCQPISMLLHERHVSKRIEKPTIQYSTLINSALQNRLIFLIFTTSRDVVRKYAKGEEVFVKKKDNSNSTLSMDVSVQYDIAVTVTLGRDLSRSARNHCKRWGVIYHVPTHHEPNHLAYLLIRGVIQHVPKTS